MKMEKHADVYQRVTDLIIEKLMAGVVPWQRPWNIQAGAPANFVSKKLYRGINILLLSSLGFESPYFLSFKQLKDLGGSVRKGEHAALVVFSKWIEAKDQDGHVVEDENGDIKTIPFLRYYHVFNVSQCSDIPDGKLPQPAPMPERTFSSIERAEVIVSGMPNPPVIAFDHFQASYNPHSDVVRMPKKACFHSDEELYATLFHELVHSTGHVSRLGRPGVKDAAYFGDSRYSREELVAEMGAAFLCATVGIENKTLDNSASYIDSWLQRLKNDKKLVIIAAGAAQKACDYVLKENPWNSEMNPVGATSLETEPEGVMASKVPERWLVCPECGNEGEPEHLMRFGYRCCRDLVNESKLENSK